MASNLDRYQADLENLIMRGALLQLSLMASHRPQELAKSLEKATATAKGEKTSPTTQCHREDGDVSIPEFFSDYQSWYSEAKVLIKQLLPERLEDFVRFYESPKNRKLITADNYTISDSLRGLSRGTVGPSYALSLFAQQFLILKGLEQRFKSSLFDIKLLVQADLFDSEIDSAKELLKHKFSRAAGALAGVVLEKHLAQVAGNHSLKISKKYPGLNDWNQLLKDNNIIETPKWRLISLLADIRNLCSHDKQTEPTMDQVQELIDGVSRVIKTVF